MFHHSGNTYTSFQDVDGSFGNSLAQTPATQSPSTQQRPNPRGGFGGAGAIDPSKYKTKLCRNFMMKMPCPFGDRCVFAHGEEQVNKGGLSTPASSTPAGDFPAAPVGKFHSQLSSAAHSHLVHAAAPPPAYDGVISSPTSAGLMSLTAAELSLTSIPHEQPSMLQSPSTSGLPASASAPKTLAAPPSYEDFLAIADAEDSTDGSQPATPNSGANLRFRYDPYNSSGFVVFN